MRTITHSQLTMRFSRMDAQLDALQGALGPLSVVVEIDAASVDASLPFVAGIVKSGAALDVAHYPEIRFVSTRFVRTGEAQGLLTGDLTIRATTHPVTLRVTLDSGAPDLGADALAFSAYGHFSRSMFGLSTGSYTVGDDVEMSIHVEFMRTGANP